ncbi:histamine H3 receptor-like [Lytechinus variegatus]|uniref:histamine H3 receptor-like n=1 Tax=Lytechinus variegatus TaxID=7654 RepID=UPI001BB1A232|nr:histamine H3 receptor-like [Lytechinus variegatus]
MKMINNTPVLSSGERSRPLSVLIPIIVIYGFLIMITVVGNLFVIISYAQDRKLRQRPANLIILNLAIADFIVGSVSLPVNLTGIVSGRWLFGQFVCRLYCIVDYVAVYMSVVIIVFISIDRYLIVAKPIKHRSLVTRKRVRYAVIPAWIIYFIWCSLTSFGWTTFGERNETDDYLHECEMEFTVNPIITLIHCLIGFFIPFSSIVFLNVLIFINVKRQFDKFPVVAFNRSSDENNGTNTLPIKRENYGNDSCELKPSSSKGTTMNINTVSKEADLNATPINTKFDQFTNARLQKNKIIAKKLAIVVLVFGICCLPYEICIALNSFCKEKCISDLVLEITENIQWANSGINPILYAFTDIQFRHNFVRLIRCRSK